MCVCVCACTCVCVVHVLVHLCVRMCKHACVLVLMMCCSLAENMMQAHVMISLASCGMVFELDAGFVQRLRCIFQASQGDNLQ